MKKTLSLLLVIVLLIGGFVYLGNVVKEKNSNSDLRVTIVVPSEFGDKTYTDSAFEGLQAPDDGSLSPLLPCCMHWL